MFDRLMLPLGPFEAAPHLAVAVSGGADSMALALLARDWARARGGRVTALVVDHGLRAGSAAEAGATLARLGALGIAAQGLALHGLARGPGLAARARAARHAALIAAARGLGVLHLLFGHHAGDQAETVAMRALSGSGAAGLAGMAALVETADLRLLRPLLTVPPGLLRAVLLAAGVAWVEDPSNDDPSALRARLRRARGDVAGRGLTRAAVEAADARGQARARAELAAASQLAARVRLHPEGSLYWRPRGFPPPRWRPCCAGFPVWRTRRPRSQVAALAACRAPPRSPACGCSRPAARPGWLLSREVAALAPPVPARPGAAWDGRFRLAASAKPPGWRDDRGAGRAGRRCARCRPHERCPPPCCNLLAVRRGAELLAVPHLGIPIWLRCAGCGWRLRPLCRLPARRSELAKG